MRTGLSTDRFRKNLGAPSTLTNWSKFFSMANPSRITVSFLFALNKSLKYCNTLGKGTSSNPFSASLRYLSLTILSVGSQSTKINPLFFASAFAMVVFPEAGAPNTIP